MKKKWFPALALLLACLIALGVSLIAGQGSRATFGGVSLSLEYATTTATQELGLGNRPYLAPDHGMLFVFSHDDYWGFWMKDTLIPLDMFWLNDRGEVLWMEQQVATDTYPSVFYPPQEARYVLELPAGFAAAHAIATGTPLILGTWPNAAP